MSANPGRFGSGQFTKLFGVTHTGLKDADENRFYSSRSLSMRTRHAVCAVFLLALAVNIAVTSHAAQTGSPQGSIQANSTSLNGPGNVFLTANLVQSGGSAFGAAYSVAVADFNGDGKPDLAVANAGGNAVSILLGNGDGTFQAPKDFTIVPGNNFTTYVAAGDFNGDGKADLAVIDNSIVYVLLGNADGTFTLKATLTGISNPQSVALGDFNGDGKLDMAVVDRTTNSVSLYLGNGDGTMQAPINTASLGIGAATYMATADFNKDNKLDLILSDQNNSQVVVLLGNGDGHFQAARSFSLNSGGGFDVAVGDFNGDGVPDIAATSPIAQTLIILLGRGDGNFQPAVSFNAGLLGGNTQNLAVGDFNKDGKLDIITSLNGSLAVGSSVSVLLGKGDGTFSAPLLLAANHTPGQLAIADFNGDGNLDWVAANTTQTRLTVALGNGNGTFQDDVNYAVGQGPEAAAGDFNKDGKLDIVTVDYPTAEVSVLLGNSNGTFQPAIKTPVPGAYYGIAVADLNGDGNQDVVVGDSTGLPPRNVNVLLGKGDGTFAAPVKYSTGGSGEGQMVIADFNGDGKLDLAVVNQADNTISILLGNGNGTFQAAKLVTPALASDGFLGYLVAADFNGDGKLDLAIPDYVGAGSGKVAILLGNGDGTFQAPTFLTTGGGATGIAAADLNKDGKVDLVVANQFGSVDVFLGNGNGTFGAPIVLDDTQSMAGVCCANPIPIVVAVGDFNLDGNLDLFIGANRANNGSPGNFVSDINFGSQLFLGKGDGTFTGPQDYLVGAGASSLVAGDFNGDGAPDVALGDQGENFVTVLLNQTPAPVSVTPKSLTFANQLVGTSSTTQPIAVKNNGAAATTTAIAVSGDFTQSNTCPVSPATLAVGASCTVNVAFKPTATGVRNGTITVSHNLAGRPETVTLTGTGVAPAVTLSATTVNFGNQGVGTSSAAQVIGLTNSGTATLNITSITITGANSGDFSQTNTCGISVAAGANCNINATFKPTATGARNASVSVADSAAGSPQTVALKGTGVTPGVMLSSANVNFGKQLVTTSSAVQNVTLTNNGTATLNIAAIAVTGANSGDFSETNTCGTSVAVGANCAISATFKPTATGNRAASVTITDDAAGSPQAVALSGVGTDYTIDVAAGGSNTATVTAGQTAAYNLQVTPVSGFNGTVALSCTGAPSEATCTPSVASVTPNGNAASAFAVNVTTTAPSIFAPRGMPPGYPPVTWIRIVLPWVLAFTLLLLLARLTPARHRTKWAYASVLVVLLSALVWTSGCGGGGGGGGHHNPGTPAGSYTLTVAGTSSGVSHTLNLTLKVN